MSFQWMFIACCLYIEIAILLILILPIASPKRWSRLFRSPLYILVTTHVTIYFYVLLAVMGLLMFDTIRDMHKYNSLQDSGNSHITTELRGNLKLFRAQRNFYITGFSIFLAFVIRHYFRMILAYAELLDHSDKVYRDLQEAVKVVNVDIVSKEISMQEEAEDLRKLHDKLIVHQQERNNMQQKITEMMAEQTAMTAQIDMWKGKYEELAAKQNIESSGVGDQIDRA